MLYLTLYFFAAVTGVVFGFLCTNICKPNQWISYVFFGILQIILGLLSGFIPEQFTCNFYNNDQDLTDYQITKYKNNNESVNHEINVEMGNTNHDLNQSILEKYVSEVVIDKLHMDKN